ncbi:MAG: glutamine amidotransferase [Arachnia sp.]
MKPFLLLSTRPEDAAAHGEHAAVASFSGLYPAQLEQIRVEAGPLPSINLDHYSAVILGGGPLNASDHDKSAVQLRVEADLQQMLAAVFDRGMGFMGLCYGVGTVTSLFGGVVDRTYGEAVGAVPVRLTEAGRVDPLLVDVPDEFRAYVGHKEACTVMPADAILLATGTACPVQMFRVREHGYVTQFHPELDAAGIVNRIQIYKHAGYFAPEETDELVQRVRRAGVSPEVHSILRRFAARYATH